ncbi:MAG: C25 family cysteine peptidase [Ignavibacteria bacterium]|nr:C25 family cysteine peptidase [Ignavibacteria bacterium]
MKRQYLLIILFLYNCSFNILSQVSLTSEKVTENKHILFYQNEFSFHISPASGQNRLQFDFPLDESKPNQFNLPTATIFIPIAANTTPQVQFIIDREEVLEAIPEVTPTITVDNQKIIHYEYNTSLPKSYNSKFLIVNGQLVKDGKSYLHLSVSPFLFEPAKRSIRRIVKFHLEITCPVNIAPTFSTQNNLNSISESKINFNDTKLVQYNLRRSDSSDKWIDYNTVYLKIGVSKDAIYHLTYNGLSPYLNLSSIIPKTLKLYKKGIEVPIYVKGEDDNVFDPEDFIEFVGERNMGGKHREVNQYGEPYNEYLDRFSDTTIYWLTWGGMDGLRVKVSDNGNLISAQDTLKYYHEVIHYEKNNWFDFSMADQVRREMPNWYENKTWHQGNLGVGTRNSTFVTSNVFTEKPFYVFSKQQSYASNINQNAHLLAISVNTSAIQDSGYIDKYSQKLLKGEYNSSILTNGNNTLKIYSFLTAASPNLCIYDWYEVEYPRWLQTYNDSLLFSFPYLDSLPTVEGIKITNVFSDSIIVWRYGKTSEKYQLLRNNSEIVFFDTLTNQDKFILINASSVSEPKIYYAKKFVNLRNPQIQADYLAITHKNFLNKTNDYTSFISNSYNVIAKVIDVDDIYDEFAYGYFNPEAIRDFLITTHNNWQTPLPKYVCLIGGATYDYHGNKTKFMNTPPKYNFVPSFGASVSDNWFITWDTTGAYIPQMNIGRIPVTSEQELDSYMTKHINYVSRASDSWNKRFTFFSGGTGDNQSQLDQLRDVNNYVINTFVTPPPVGGNSTHFYKTINPNTNFGPYSEAEFQKTIDEGSVFISYLGHSGTQTWDNSITTPSQLKSKGFGSPLITDFGCSTARFGEPDVTSFSQLFVVSNEGEAIAYIGNSSLGFLSTSLLGPKLFYEKVLIDSVSTISEALKLAKLKMLQTYGSTGVYKLFALTNTLIGDPIAQLRIPNKPNLSITPSDIYINSTNPSDLMDSLSVSLNYYNFGKVTNDSFSVVINDAVADTNNFNLEVNKSLPNFSNSMKISIPIRKKPGEHTFSIHLDANNSVDELSEVDNSVSIKYLVVGSSIKTMVTQPVENGLGDLLRLINPASKQQSDSLEIEFATNDSFKNSQVVHKSLDTLFTSLSMANLQKDTRYWARTKTAGNEQFGSSFSFIKTNDNKYFLSDSLSFSKSTLANLQYLNRHILFDSITTVFSAFSAGFSDGNSASIQKNSKNYIPENTLRGHHVCVFDDSSFEFISYRLFDVFGGETNNYINFLNTLSNKYIVIIAVSDEGSVSSSELKNQIKSLGSIYIDSLVFRGSWAIIGKKGAVPGSVPEAFSKPGNGSVKIDTTYYTPNKSGSLLTSEIGPVGKWDSLSVEQIISNELVSSYRPLGIRDNGIVDTLNVLSVTNNTADLNSIDARLYPKIKILSAFRTESDSISPNLSSLSVKFHTLPELATNYQVVSISRDTLIQGDSLDLKFYVYNVGESPADSFHVLVDVMKEDNSSRQLLDTVVASLDSMQRKMFTLNYMTNTTDGKGNMGFKIKIDPENHVRELYKDNNEFTIPFFTKPDTNVVSVSASSVSVTFDNTEILNGDFVSGNPSIKIDLKYPTWFAVSDTSSLSILLDNERIPFNQLNIKNDSANRTLTFAFIPSLTNGEHQFKIFGNNVYGKLDNQPGFERVFLVSNELAIMNCYNYPNPVKDNTYFTFILSQFPVELTIRIYTVAGRLVKEIKRSSAESFNHIYWDTKDQDGNFLANGVYLYKVIVKRNEKSESVTQKLAIVK